MQKLALVLLLVTVSAAYADLDPPASWNSALPLQAAVCDVAGIGHVLSQNSTNTSFRIDTFWYGITTNNPIDIDMRGEQSLPTNGIVFFVSRYGTFLDLEPMNCRFSYIFDMNYHRSRYEPDGMYLLNGARSWFPATTENADMTAWCSNLVYVSQVNTNLQAFYELIRDGYRLNPATSRIRRDSEYTFQYCSYYMTTNFMHQIWSDTNLVGEARSWINNRYWLETKTWLP